MLNFCIAEYRRISDQYRKSAILSGHRRYLWVFHHFHFLKYHREITENKNNFPHKLPTLLFHVLNLQINCIHKMRWEINEIERDKLLFSK